MRAAWAGPPPHSGPAASARLSASRPTRSARPSPALFDAENAARHRARIAQPPAPVLDGMEEFGDGPVEGLRLLEIDGVAGLGNDQQARARDRALHQEAGLEAGLVLVPGHDEGGDGELLHALR